MPCIMQLVTTSTHNYLMQSKIILIGVTSAELLFPGASLQLFRIKYCLFQQGSGGAMQASPVGAEPRKPKHC